MSIPLVRIGQFLRFSMANTFFANVYKVPILYIHYVNTSIIVRHTILTLDHYVFFFQNVSPSTEFYSDTYLTIFKKYIIILFYNIDTCIVW